MLVEQINRWKVLLNIIDWIREKWKTMKKHTVRMYLLFFRWWFPIVMVSLQEFAHKIANNISKDSWHLLVGILPKMMINSKAKALTLQHGVGEM